MADLAFETNDLTLLTACERLFDNLTGRQLYVTGGPGPSGANEGFTREYDLPNETAYAETCAAVALAFWGHRMAQIELDSRFTDHVELVLFNGALSGIARDGEHYFYENVLESHGQHRRWKWHYCPCCPTNIARLIASLGGYFYTTKADELAVHLYAANSAEAVVGGQAVKLTQRTAYPWDGDIVLSVDPASPAEFTLRLRIPGWCRQASVSINGQTLDLGTMEKGYLPITRLWQAGDVVRLGFDMPVERLYAHPEVSEDAGKVTLKRGPVVYCAEQADLGYAPQLLALPGDSAVSARFDPELLGGAVRLEAKALKSSAAGWTDTLYATRKPEMESATLTAIPYHLWANREPGGMAVWIREH
jgi:DUF1680 family protein